MKSAVRVFLLPFFLSLLSAGIAEDADAVLEENCRVCHGAAMQQSGLDLRTRESILKGGERGAGMVPHYPERSWILRLASGEVNPTMPPGGKLSPQDLAVLTDWIEAGAPLPSPAEGSEEAAKFKR